MHTALIPVPQERIHLSALSWHRSCEVLNPSMPHFRTQEDAIACDIQFSVGTSQLSAPCAIVISIKGALKHGAVMLQLLGADAKSLATLSFNTAQERPNEHQGELVVIPTTATLTLRISGIGATEFALTYLHVSYSPDETLIPLPAEEPCIFPNWDRLYQPALLTATERLRRQDYNALTMPTPTPWHRGLRIMLHPHDGLSSILATSGFYEPHELMVLKRLLQPGDTFIDCGANIGFYTLYAASLVGTSGRVLAFEPSAREMQRLHENIALNTLPQIECFSCALSDHEGSAQFSIAEGAGENTLAQTFGYTDTQLTQRVTVELRTLDNITANYPSIKLIKIDVEGAELHVLKGTQEILKRARPAILFEVFPAALLRMQSTPGMIDEMLRAAGYRFYTIHPVTAEWEALDTLHHLHQSCNVLALPE